MKSLKESSTIKVFLVDDHEVVRNGLRYCFMNEDDITLVGEAANGMEALGELESLSPDVIITDIKMPEMNGIELTRQVKQRHPSCNVLILTLYDEYVMQATEAGASGYFLKGCAWEELYKAVHHVHEDFH
jgi:YesN/AraC family two-component response regulator